MNDRRANWHIRDPETQRRILANLARFKLGDRRWRGRLAIPKNCPPAVRQLFELLNDQRTTMSELAKRVGTHRETIADWRTKSSPTLALFEAAANALGHEIKLVPKKDF